MNSSINKFNPFQTIAGYNQVNELKNFGIKEQIAKLETINKSKYKIDL